MVAVLGVRKNDRAGLVTQGLHDRFSSISLPTQAFQKNS